MIIMKTKSEPSQAHFWESIFGIHNEQTRFAASACNKSLFKTERKKGLNDVPSPTTTNFRFKSGRLEFDDDDGVLSIECS